MDEHLSISDVKAIGADDEQFNKNMSDSVDSSETTKTVDCEVDRKRDIELDGQEVKDNSSDNLMNITPSHTNTQLNIIAVKKPGYACIKPEFLVPDHKPVLHAEFVCDATKLQLQNREVLPSELCDNEPPAKKPKLKGRNKHRPRNEKIQAKDKMCPSIQMNKVCTYGERCIYNHDKIDFIKKKLPDLEGSCYLFNTFGKCHFGLTCRFAKNHLSENFDNVINVEIFEKMKNYKILNELSVDVKKKLWKKKFNFQRADSIVKEVGKNGQRWNSNSNPSLIHVSPEEKQSHSEVLKHFNTTEPEIHIAQNNIVANNEQIVIEEINTSLPPATEFKAQLETAINSNILCQQDTIEKVEIIGSVTDEDIIRIRPVEKVRIDFKNKLYLAPLTTVGNLPFRRICKSFGADITCGEMALSTQLLKGKLSEWSLIKRHPSEDIFGVQLCGAYPDTMTRCTQLLTETAQIDFIDINCGCPIDLICKKGAGSALMSKPGKLEQICRSMKGVMGDMPLTVKLRTGELDGKNVAHNIIPRLQSAGVSLVTIHGRSKAQRYTKLADWRYISECASVGAPSMSIYGNGDILSFEDANVHLEQSGVSGLMIARGALIKPWIFTEIKEQRHWDISSGERFDILRTYSNYGLEHWGSDHQGVENTRRFLLEWLSFMHRYIPVGVLEVVPQRINERPPYFVGRNDLETLMASASCADWIKISEMLLGPVPANFHFLPKHKANAYQ